MTQHKRTSTQADKNQPKHTVGGTADADVMLLKKPIGSNPLFDNMQTAVVLTDENLYIQDANSAAENLLFSSVSKLLNSDFQQFFHDSIELLPLTQRAISHAQSFSLRDVSLVFIHTQLKPSTDNAMLVDVSVTPITLNKNATHLLFELRTAERHTNIAYEEQIHQQHYLTKQLIRGVAHEIKNPLAGIRGAAQLLQRAAKSLNLDEKIKKELDEYSDVIILESDRLKNLADAMLGSNQLPQMRQINIHEVLEHVCKLIKGQFNQIKIMRDYDVSLPEFEADKARLIQVFLNICLNAAQALSENVNQNAPQIKIKTRIKNHHTIAGKNHKHLICISIIDNGKGIDKAVIDTLFYPMVSGRAQGTGLGLSIAQDIVQQHQGVISVESEPGKTAFHIYLPTLSTEMVQKE